MAAIRRTASAIAVTLTLLGAQTTGAAAHPHVFVNATMEITGTKDGHLAELRNVWMMDELFSSSVIVDFDKNANGRLDKDELAAIGEQVRGSIAQWSFYTFVKKGIIAIELEPPGHLDVTYDEKHSQLRFVFTMKPKTPVDLTHGAVTFSNFDNTYFVAFDYADEKSFVMKNLPKSCRRVMSAPSPDDAAKAWMNSISKLGTDDTIPMPEDGIKFSEVLATKFRLDCG